MASNVKSNYGVENPRPAAAVGFANTKAVGEMLGNTADESATAQYTPITGGVAVGKPDTQSLALIKQVYPGIIPEGTLMLCVSNADNITWYPCDAANYVQEGTQTINVVRPLASDLPTNAYPDNKKIRSTTYRHNNEPANQGYASIAWANTATVRLHKGMTCSGESYPAGMGVWVGFRTEDEDGNRCTRVDVKIQHEPGQNDDGEEFALLGTLVLAKLTRDTAITVCITP